MQEGRSSACQLVSPLVVPPADVAFGAHLRGSALRSVAARKQQDPMDSHARANGDTSPRDSDAAEDVDLSASLDDLLGKEDNARLKYLDELSRIRDDLMSESTLSECTG